MAAETRVDTLPEEEDRRRRYLVVGAVVLALLLLLWIFFGGGGAYTVKATFINGGQLVEGNPVQTGGASIGTVKSIEITDDGQAEVTLEVDDEHSPLRQGTIATVRQLSPSGIANRYVDLTMPPAGADEIPDGGLIEVDSTMTQVDLDELFNTLDPPTREALQDFFKGSAAMFEGRAEEANAGFRYLNPALATSRRLFGELTHDTPVLERFLVDSSRLVTALADRRDDLASLIGDLNEATRALGDRKAELAESIGRLPPVMRRANTTFVNLRTTLDDVDPLVDASKPVARLLDPFLSNARAFTADAEPTVADLRAVIRRRGASNDLTDLVNSVPPLADIALETSRRQVAPGGRDVDLGETRGAFPEAVDAFRAATPEIGLGRAYTTDFFGWFDDFSNTGPGYDATGAIARASISFAENLPPLGPVRQGQYRRCPGSAERPAADGSNVLSLQEMQELQCEESARGTGNAR